MVVKSLSTMVVKGSLYIGKNREDAAPVKSIFRLMGNDEDALTYALGYLLAYDPTFCTNLIRSLKVAPRSWTLSPDYRIHLQEITGKGFGRRDLVVEDGDLRIVIEAKIGDSEPTAEQILKYASDHEHWEQYKTRVVVALTQVQLSKEITDQVHSDLPQEIDFKSIQWYGVIDLLLRHKAGSNIGRYLLDQLIYHIRSYGMNYHDAEVYIQDVNSDNAKIYREGRMYVGCEKRAPMYFAPYFTKEMEEYGISQISRVEHVKLVKVRDLEELDCSDEHWSRGLCLIRNRVRNDHRWKPKPDDDVRLLYLGNPVTLTSAPLRKRTGKSKVDGWPLTGAQIAPGFSLTFERLLSAINCRAEP